MRTKFCGKCGGNLTDRRDHYGPYSHCLQCGNIVYESAWGKTPPPPKRNPFAAEARSLAQKRSHRRQPGLL